MKKLFAIIAACVIVGSVSAQGWQTGIRIGSGFQAVGAYEFANQNSVEARFGMNWYWGTPVNAEFQILYYFHVYEGSNNLFVDCGFGAELGGRTPGIHYGVMPSVKFGYKLTNDIKLAIDWSPIIGGVTVSSSFAGQHYSNSEYFTRGLANVGISCTYSF